MILKNRGVAIAAGVFVCLAVGAGFERVRQAVMAPATVPEPAEVKNAGPVQVVRRVVVTNTASERAVSEALRKRVAELEQVLATREAEKEPAPAKPDEAPHEERPRRQSFTERLEQLKKENPEQYAEMQKRREEFRQTMEQRAQERVNFLDAVNTQNMNDEQRENHEKLVATVARLSELRTLMEQSGAERTPEMRQEMGEAFFALGELYGAERRYLFEETARAVGYEGSQATEFADHMQTIIDNTTMSGFGHRGGHGNNATAADGAH